MLETSIEKDPCKKKRESKNKKKTGKEKM